MINTLNRSLGSFLGLAIGDALGTTLEFRAPGSFTPLTDMVGGGPFSLEPGQWTDDTSMALCLAESLIECKRCDLKDQLQRFLRWHNEGYWSSTGQCFDIGNTVSSALNQFVKSGDPYSGPTHERSAGNGSLMRLAPIPIFYQHQPMEAIEMAGESSRTTHGNPMAIDSCRYFSGLIVGALHGEVKESLLSPRYTPVEGVWERYPLHPEIEAIAMGSFRTKSPPEIIGSGFVVQSMEAALWAFYHSTSFEEGALLAANLGYDADTTAAIYGQLAGAFYGLEHLPAKWLSLVAMRKEITTLIERLVTLAPRSEG
ncbi:MAG: ADP-ribosylglycohydrolase family protein [Gammaproteobacteria bacterium]|nr:ADP-ribosylglycohydrolase family protein [Gammaproteobacteria bacterium]